MNKSTIVILLVFVPHYLFSKPKYSKAKKEKLVSEYFENIRDNSSLLRYFFQSMPKGADLHHHYSGSVYAETYLKAIEHEDLWVQNETYELLITNPPELERSHWSRISELKCKGLWNSVKLKLIKSWSTKYYNNYGLPSDEHFYATFKNFNLAKAQTYKLGLLEIKNRAKKEKVFYIESMFDGIKFRQRFDFEKEYRQRLLELQKVKNGLIQEELESLYQLYKERSNYLEVANKHNDEIRELHESLKIDDADFTMRYHNYVVRITNPVHVFKHLLVCFQSASTSGLIVGVNIVAQEHNTVSMRDYWLHMQMFKFFKSKFPEVQYSLHAGELTLGLVKPEELTWHIGEAVNVAEANRIGHGVSIVYEKNAQNLLKKMSVNKIAVEINQSSNDFILGVSGKEHPIILYEKNQVPIVICTDDAGVLRTDLCQQYVLLASNFKEINYLKIKEYVYNSIEYSFLDDNSKMLLTQKTKLAFSDFETDLIHSGLIKI